MRSNIDRRSSKLEQRDDVNRVDLDYDDGEIVAIALVEKAGEDFDDFVEDTLGLDVESKQFVGFATEVIVK